jgi:hypothetical protein
MTVVFEVAKFYTIDEGFELPVKILLIKQIVLVKIN